MQVIIAPDCFTAPAKLRRIYNIVAGNLDGFAYGFGCRWRWQVVRPFFVQIFPLLLIFVVFYLFLIRPQQKRAKEHEAKLNAVQKNDEVMTGGGLMGKVTKVADDHVEVEIAPQCAR